MSSVESLSMGLVCMTELVEQYKNFIPDNPFVNINKKTLKDKIIKLSKNKDLLIKKKLDSKNWVKKYHDVENVYSSLQSYYRKIYGRNK